jgi:hypothetical protein
MKQFKNYKSPRPAPRAWPESIVSKILWFTVEHAVGILAVIILLILWRLFMV